MVGFPHGPGDRPMFNFLSRPRMRFISSQARHHKAIEPSRIRTSLEHSATKGSLSRKSWEVPTYRKWLEYWKRTKLSILKSYERLWTCTRPRWECIVRKEPLASPIWKQDDNISLKRDLMDWNQTTGALIKSMQVSNICGFSLKKPTLTTCSSIVLFLEGSTLLWGTDTPYSMNGLFSKFFPQFGWLCLESWDHSGIYLGGICGCVWNFFRGLCRWTLPPLKPMKAYQMQWTTLESHLPLVHLPCSMCVCVRYRHWKTIAYVHLHTPWSVLYFCFEQRPLQFELHFQFQILGEPPPGRTSDTDSIFEVKTCRTITQMREWNKIKLSEQSDIL